MTVPSTSHDLDARARPPDTLKALYKKYQKVKSPDLASDGDLLDFSYPEKYHSLKLFKQIRYKEKSSNGLRERKDTQYPSMLPKFLQNCNDVTNVYELEDMPGKDFLHACSTY
jgi:hypothetical protein